MAMFNLYRVIFGKRSGKVVPFVDVTEEFPFAGLTDDDFFNSLYPPEANLTYGPIRRPYYACDGRRWANKTHGEMDEPYEEYEPDDEINGRYLNGRY
jgi:hypothetical protein